MPPAPRLLPQVSHRGRGAGRGDPRVPPREAVEDRRGGPPSLGPPCSRPASGPVTPKDPIATLDRRVGIDPRTSIDDRRGRSYVLSERGPRPASLPGRW